MGIEVLNCHLPKSLPLFSATGRDQLRKTPIETAISACLDCEIPVTMPAFQEQFRHGILLENLMYVQFNMFLSWRALEEKNQWDHTENDAAKHAELVHVREQHRLALHGVVKVRQGKVTMICDIA
jgi:hypothetical protein